MALDDQLAALAAGELDDDTVRALRARAAADPALARRLARHERLQELLDGWETPPMSDAAAQRLEARVEEALAELDDAPLAERTSRSAPLAAVPEPEPDRQPRGVVDLGRERARRAAPSGGGGFAWPNWGAGAAVAAVLVAIVGAGVVLGGLPGGTGLDTLAGGDDSAEEESAEMTEDSADDSGDDAADGAEAAQPDMDAEMEEEAAADDGEAAGGESAQLGPSRRSGLEVEEGELLALVDVAGAPTDTAAEESTDESAADEGAVTTEAAEQCVTEALQRDTSQAEGREMWLLADGTYAGRDAVFVVVRTPATPDDRYEVLAYDPADCSLLARDETSR